MKLKYILLNPTLVGLEGHLPQVLDYNGIQRLISNTELENLYNNKNVEFLNVFGIKTFPDYERDYIFSARGFTSTYNNVVDGITYHSECRLELAYIEPTQEMKDEILKSIDSYANVPFRVYNELFKGYSEIKTISFISIETKEELSDLINRNRLLSTDITELMGGYIQNNSGDVSVVALTDMIPDDLVPGRELIKYDEQIGYIDITGMNFSNTTNFNNMFYDLNCHEIFMKGCDFSKAKLTNAMFMNAHIKFGTDLGGFKGAKIDSALNMLFKAQLMELENLESLDIANVKVIGDMFFGLRTEKAIDFSKFNKVTPELYSIASSSMNYGDIVLDNADYMNRIILVRPDVGMLNRRKVDASINSFKVTNNVEDVHLFETFAGLELLNDDFIPTIIDSINVPIRESIAVFKNLKVNKLHIKRPLPIGGRGKDVFNFSEINDIDVKLKVDVSESYFYGSKNGDATRKVKDPNSKIRHARRVTTKRAFNGAKIKNGKIEVDIVPALDNSGRSTFGFSNATFTLFETFDDPQELPTVIIKKFDVPHDLGTLSIPGNFKELIVENEELEFKEKITRKAKRGKDTSIHDTDVWVFTNKNYDNRLNKDTEDCNE